MLETRSAAFEADTPLERAIEQADVCVFITDLEGRIQYVNETFEQTTGYSRADVMGQTPRILRSDEHSSDFYRDLWETIQCGEVWKGRITNRRKDGVLIHDRTTISPVKDETGTVVNYVAVASDVSKRS